MDPQQHAIAKEFDGYATGYNDVVNGALSFTGMKVDIFVQAKADHILASIDRHFGRRQDLAVLDLGCGVGNYHDFFRSAFGRLAGADVSESCIAQARSLRPEVDYMAYDGIRLPVEDGTFDVVYAICVLHHVPVPVWQTFVGEMYRVIRPGGLALIYEHNPGHPLTMRVVNNCPFDADATLLPPARTRELLGQAGFEQVDSRSIITVPPLQAPIIKPLLSNLDGFLGGLPFGTQYCASAVRAA